jgi:hypothetical protein
LAWNCHFDVSQAKLQQNIVICQNENDWEQARRINNKPRKKAVEQALELNDISHLEFPLLIEDTEKLLICPQA